MAMNKHQIKMMNEALKAGNVMHVIPKAGKENAFDIIDDDVKSVNTYPKEAYSIEICNADMTKVIGYYNKNREFVPVFICNKNSPFVQPIIEEIKKLILLYKV